MLSNVFNPSMTVPELSHTGVYGEYMLYQNKIIFCGLNSILPFKVNIGIESV